MNDMKKLSEYKEFFYRDRSLEEFKNSPIWIEYIYPFINESVEYTETHRTPDNDFLIGYLLKKDIPNFSKSVFERCIRWSNPVISRIEKIGESVNYLYNVDYDELQELELQSVFGVIWLLKNPSPLLVGVKNLLYNKLKPERDENFRHIIYARERYDFDFSPHPDFKALEQKDEAWWKEATGDYNEARIRTILSLYEGEERERMRILLKDKTGVELPAEAKEEGKAEAMVAKKEIPADFQTEEAKRLLGKLEKAGYLDANWQPKDLTNGQRGALISILSPKLFPNSNGAQWKKFSKWWNFKPDTQRSAYNEWLSTIDAGDFEQEVEKLLGL